MAVSKKVRFEVFKRDSYTCKYCGHHPPDVKLEVGHVVPVCEGGGDNTANLVTSCFACNRGKGGRPLGDALPPVDEMHMRAEMQEAMERAYDMRAALAAAEEERSAFDSAVDSLEDYAGVALDCVPERRSLAIFAARMPIDDLYRAVRDTLTRLRPGMSSGDRWRYFCGVCWRMIKERAAA